MKPSTRMSAAAMRVTDVTDEPAPGPRAAFKRVNNCTTVTSCHSHANVLVHEQQESCRRNITNNAGGPRRALEVERKGVLRAHQVRVHGQAAVRPEQMRIQAVVRRMLAVPSEECRQVEHPLAIHARDSVIAAVAAGRGADVGRVQEEPRRIRGCGLSQQALVRFNGRHANTSEPPTAW